MLRVMLIDDEPMALEGLKLLIDWEKEGFAICACHKNGTDALQDISRAQPDLIVTDLRMPETDGIQVITRARQNGYDGQFLIVSGYGDFQMAQQAMRYNVAGYLLKPIDPKEVSETLETVRALLITRELRGGMDISDAHEAITLLLGGQLAPEGALPSGCLWRLLTWGAPLPYERGKELIKLLRTEGVTVSAHIVGGLEWIVLRWAEDAAAPCITPLEQALAHDRRMLVAGTVIHDAALLPAQAETLRSAYQNASNRTLALVSRLIQAVSVRDTEESVRLADELQVLCDTYGTLTLHHTYTALLAGFAQQLSDRPERAMEIIRTDSRDIREVSLMTIRLLAPEASRVSDQVIRYAELHYASRGLTLVTAADALGYNATYLGRVFREETGKGFRDWLNDLRIEKAAALLAATRDTVYQITEAVGYPQYKQFLRHFKDRYHATPEQYRKSVTP